MSIEYMGFGEVNGPLVVLDGVSDCGYEEIAEITMDNGEKRLGQVIKVEGDKAVLQVFEGTSGISLQNTKQEEIQKSAGKSKSYCNI